MPPAVPILHGGPRPAPSVTAPATNLALWVAGRTPFRLPGASEPETPWLHTPERKCNWNTQSNGESGVDGVSSEGKGSPCAGFQEVETGAGSRALARGGW